MASKENKILDFKLEGNKLIAMSCWIKNDVSYMGYANGYMIAHKSLKLIKADSSNFNQEITMRENLADLSKKYTISKFKFIFEFMRKLRQNINEYELIGFDTGHSFNRHYSRHNVETDLKEFFKLGLSYSEKVDNLENLIKDLEEILSKLELELKNRKNGNT